MKSHSIWGARSVRHKLLLNDSAPETIMLHKIWNCAVVMLFIGYVEASKQDKIRFWFPTILLGKTHDELLTNKFDFPDVGL